MEEVNMANFVPPLSITSPSSPTRSERISKIISPSMAAVSPNTSFELKARLSLKSREVHLCVEKALSLLSKTHGETTDIEIKDPKTRYHNYYFKAHRECLSRAIASIQKELEAGETASLREVMLSLQNAFQSVQKDEGELLSLMQDIDHLRSNRDETRKVLQEVRSIYVAETKHRQAAEKAIVKETETTMLRSSYRESVAVDKQHREDLLARQQDEDILVEMLETTRNRAAEREAEVPDATPAALTGAVHGVHIRARMSGSLQRLGRTIDTEREMRLEEKRFLHERLGAAQNKALELERALHDLRREMKDVQPEADRKTGCLARAD
ncbi:hypothetical protein CYMTET_14571 [Cymbomonas tetramitiformis]|uniref:Uncharacterized protein n=1 Tax=Cymbomonas tetramitiformis TaxID=36881 RepID=A0AAE0GG15_9CHLO|nr:hypothetical protein CYMTET_14571 [Cymbomonas tetramitiformis]